MKRKKKVSNEPKRGEENEHVNLKHFYCVIIIIFFTKICFLPYLWKALAHNS